jgi:superfamily II DNA helicase RecQ
MIEYADTSACLRAAILRYFGDAAARERCDACGSCRPGAADGYERALVRKILSGIARAGERYGRYRIVAMLLGDTSGLPPALTGLSTAGSLGHETSDAIRGWIDASIAAGLIVVSKDQYRTLSLTDRGRDAMRGRLHDLDIRRPAAAGLPLRRRRRLVRGWDDWRDSRTFRRRAWSVDLDTPFEFERDFSREFDAPDE